MKRHLLALAMLAVATPAFAQIGGIIKGVQTARKLNDVVFTDEEEQQLGAGVSEKIRLRYGVVQDRAVHRYVSLVGSVLALAGGRPALSYHFIILDTDGVNAYAAPGGYIHITRGALGLIKSEAELADVLAHEIIHVTEKHTIRAIQKTKAVQIGAGETLAGNTALFSSLVDKMTEAVMSGFDRGDELEADEKGIVLSNNVGYAAVALSAFLTRLADRNKGVSEKQGLFASHPEMKERLDKIDKLIAARKLTAAVTLDGRYKKFVAYDAKPQTQIALVETGAAGLVGGSAKTGEKAEGGKTEEPKKKGFGLSSLMKPGGEEKKSAQVTGSGGSRGVDTERDAKGGSNPAVVGVTLTAADIAAFRKEGNLPEALAKS